jgi:hypothetical protein
LIRQLARKWEVGKLADAGAGSDVEDPLRFVLVDWGEVKLVPERHDQDEVVQVESLNLGL